MYEEEVIQTIMDLVVRGVIWIWSFKQQVFEEEVIQLNIILCEYGTKKDKQNEVICILVFFSKLFLFIIKFQSCFLSFDLKRKLYESIL